jgi:hypothetical protein
MNDIPIYYISSKPKKCYLDGIHWPIYKEKKSILELRQNNIISIRVYDDLKHGRVERSGINKISDIQRILTHISIWELELPYVIIIDNKKCIEIPLNKIQSAISSNKIYVNDDNFSLYAIDKKTSKLLLNNAFPISIKLDYYISWICKKYSIPIIREQNDNSINNLISYENWCIQCYLPKSSFIYIIIGLILLIIIVYTVYRIKRKCK